jgi:shikimate dehydrogenase
MIKMLVAGSPIGHSLSPLLHKHAYDLLNVQAEFTAQEVEENNFADFYYQSRDSGIRGLALTMPLKEISIGFVDRVDPLAKQISSINTIIFESTGSIGLSTDLLVNYLKNLTFFLNLLKLTVLHTCLKHPEIQVLNYLNSNPINMTSNIS